jgi:hypothetical protein
MITQVIDKKYHWKRLEQLTISHIGDIPQLDTPTYEQKRWILNRLRGPAWTWKRWYE